MDSSDIVQETDKVINSEGSFEGVEHGKDIQFTPRNGITIVKEEHFNNKGIYL